MEKYYTPEIEEFHVGFEYELLQKSKWIKDVYMCNSKVGVTFDDMPELAKLSRVKHLDKEDIESLDFAREPVKYHHSFSRGDYKLCYLSDDNPTELTILKRKKSNYLGESKYKLIFVGTIKNKSELKRILKQIGV